jgi:hypothetical protein
MSTDRLIGDDHSFIPLQEFDDDFHILLRQCRAVDNDTSKSLPKIGPAIQAIRC